MAFGIGLVISSAATSITALGKGRGCPSKCPLFQTLCQGLSRCHQRASSTWDQDPNLHLSKSTGRSSGHEDRVLLWCHLCTSASATPEPWS